MKLIDKLPTPSFVTDPAGRILHANSRARTLCDCFRQSRITAPERSKEGSRTSSRDDRSLLEMVHPDQRRVVEEALKGYAGEPGQSVDVLMLVNAPEKRLVCACELGISIDLINQGTCWNIMW